jgi:hypothetical protein
MQDRPLATTVRQVWMIRHVEQVEHDRPKAEVKGNVFTDLGPRVAADLQFFQSSALNLPHSNDLALQVLTKTFGVRPEYAIDHPAQILQVGDMVDFRILRRNGHGLSF